ncbi:MAG: hypothetical protein L5656_01470 [Thermanaeromonas sp.]|nr:hypothetical protein [Thermanaeromonas sp.]MCG0277191.1 hypothetical protein [Thermanaeromonas sp.]
MAEVVVAVVVVVKEISGKTGQDCYYFCEKGYLSSRKKRELVLKVS